LQQTAFKSGTSSFNVPGQEIRFHDEGIHAVGTTNEKKQSFWVMWIDEGYQETFGMSLVAGRNFMDGEKDRNICLINESAAISLGYKNPSDALNTTILTSDVRHGKPEALTVIGIWKDYHHQSIRKPVEPIVFYHRHPFEYGYYSFQVQSREGNYLADLEKIWNKHYPNDQFIYYFMDSFYEQQYRADELFGKLLNLFSVISIVVACLGLFGMASLALVKRTKEIGVRKVLGATVWNILVMISMDYIKLIAISCVFAFPAAYYITTQWLDGFAYKINVSWWMIVLPGVLVLLVTLLTISGQSIRAAMTNPADCMKDE
jgi:putative ABC transport system permease protein